MPFLIICSQPFLLEHQVAFQWKVEMVGVFSQQDVLFFFFFSFFSFLNQDTARPLARWEQVSKFWLIEDLAEEMSPTSRSGP